jgi:CubicO group peptidase (beta-lactamase class C family)
MLANYQKVTNMSYKKAMERMIFKPLGMKHTYVFEYETDKDTAVTLYKGNSRNRKRLPRCNLWR